MSKRALCLVVLLAASGAAAQSYEEDDGGATSATGVEVPEQAVSQAQPQGLPAVEPLPAALPTRTLPRRVEPRLPPFGLALDGGFPDFAGLSLVWRPIWLLRLHGGALFNGVGPGVRGGITVIPFNFPITPTLTAEYGYYFGGDASFITDSLPLSQTEGAIAEALGNLQYHFANLQLGVEAGVPGRFVIYLRAGLSYVDTTLYGSGALVEEQSGDPNLSVEDFRIRGTIPSVKLGLLFYFG
ncbi:MAG TPA: hypothetical protein VK013_09360 [Myxococcaceae bacterium]|nr:hypothetical protein [Myxococcaceae bacterium]